MELQGLIDKTMMINEACTVDEYLNWDDDLPVRVDINNDSWRGNFLAQLGHKEQEEVQDEEEEELDNEPPPLKVQSYKEAIQSLEDTQ